ncbi:MAG: T9SS type A sorting domain-containing protein [Flavipsychrobacter sp.]
MKPVLLFLSTLLISYTACAQTVVSGGIYSNTIWNKSANPIIVKNEVVVFSGATLSIGPGVVLKFDKNAKITVRGHLNVIGSKNDSIRFTSNSPTPMAGDYLGIVSEVNSAVPFGQKNNQININYVVVEYAKEFLDFGVSGGNGPYSIKNSRFNNNLNILQYLSAACRSTSFYFENCLFTNNKFCITGGGEDQHVYINNCWFIKNEQGTSGGYVTNCFYTENTKLGAFLYHEIHNSYFFNNEIGANVDMHHDTKFVNNQVYNNKIGVVINRMTSPTPGILFEKNKICHNTTWNIRHDFTHNIDLTDNCWCSNDSSFIASKIRDGYDDISYGLVKFDYHLNCTTTTPPQLNISRRVLKNTQSKVFISPNPTKEKIKLTSEYSDYQVTISTLDGQILKHLNVSSNSITIDVSFFPSGLYILKMQNENGLNQTEKILIQ